MAKAQINFRADELTKWHLDQMIEAWDSTQTAVIQRAIDRLYQQEMVDKVRTITVSWMADGLWGQDDPAQYYDWQGWQDRYEEMLSNALAAAYPGAEIEIERESDTRLVNDERDHDEIPWVQQIEEKCWTDWLDELASDGEPAAQLVRETGGYYEISQDSDPESWTEIEAGADTVTLIETLTGWSPYMAAYRAVRGDEEWIYFVCEQDINLKSWPGFDPNRHVYAVATGGGDGWETTDIVTAVEDDLQNAIDNGSDAQALSTLEWIDMAQVVEDGYIVAELDTTTGEWQMVEPPQEL